MKNTILLAPAKINLGLSILGKLPNGYHELKTIYTQINLYDKIILTEIPQDIIRVISNEKNIPINENNIAYKAAKLIKQQYQIKEGIKISLCKKIPIGSGLGGGSSDAAAVLKGLNQLWNLQITNQEMLNLAKKLGSDVAYQLTGGVKIETQGGEKAGIFTPLPNLPPCYICICYPDIKRESQQAFKEIEYTLIGKNDLSQLINAIKKHNLKEIALDLHNDFELWTLNKFPQITEIKNIMKQAGALNCLMSGKGSSVFGIFDSQIQGLETLKKLKQKYKNSYLVQTKPHHI